MSLFLRCTFAILLTGILAGCARPEPDHGPAPSHVHTAPHGGTLIAVGEHQFNVELMLDPAAGRLTAWLLDAHAENFVRSAMPALTLSVPAGGQARSLVLRPVANAATGETVGDTAQFEAAADWLVGAAGLTGEFAQLDFRGAVFTGVKFQVAPAGAGPDHSGHAH